MSETRIFDNAMSFRRAQQAVPLPMAYPTTAKAVLTVAPNGFRISNQTRSDNIYMRPDGGADDAKALQEHRALVRAIDDCLPVVGFAGSVDTPDAVFPNNAFATINGRLIVGAMRHEERQREVLRADLPRFFRTRLGYSVARLDTDPACIAELTGSLVIDRGRNTGYCGLSERCNKVGALAMSEAFSLARTFVFDLAAGEYHSNVVLAVLASRLLLICRDGFRDPADADTIAASFAPHVVWLDADEKSNFCANAIALDGRTAWFSARAARSLRPESRAGIEAAGFSIRSVPLEEIEKAGGSLRCCLAEIF